MPTTTTIISDPLLPIRSTSSIGYLPTPQDNQGSNINRVATKHFHPFKAPTSVITSSNHLSNTNNNSISNDSEVLPVSLDQLPFQSQLQQHQQAQMEMQQFPPMGLQDPRDTPTSPHLPLPSPFSPAVQAAHTLLNFHNATPPPQ